MPQYSDEITLIGVSGYMTNPKGDPIPTPVERTILAERKSIRQSEFYQAQATGLRPEIMFEIWSFEYQGERKLRYLGRTYSIIRTFEKGEDEKVELVCSGPVNNNATA